MHFVQTIYINNKPLVLTNSAEAYLAKHPVAQGYDRYVGAFHRNFRMAKKLLDSAFSHGVIIEDIDVDILRKELHNYFKTVYAGGGLVRNGDGAVLMIYRRGKWDLPKGKLDEGEDIADCALREVTEETGISGLALGDEILRTYHIYTERDTDILKETVWYNMSVVGAPELQPQAEENILEAKWVPQEQIYNYVKHSYQGIKDVLSAEKLLKF